MLEPACGTFSYTAVFCSPPECVGLGSLYRISISWEAVSDFAGSSCVLLMPSRRLMLTLIFSSIDWGQNAVGAAVPHLAVPATGTAMLLLRQERRTFLPALTTISGICGSACSCFPPAPHLSYLEDPGADNAITAVYPPQAIKIVAFSPLPCAFKWNLEGHHGTCFRLGTFIHILDSFRGASFCCGAL